MTLRESLDHASPLLLSLGEGGFVIVFDLSIHQPLCEVFSIQKKKGGGGRVTRQVPNYSTHPCSCCLPSDL